MPSFLFNPYHKLLAFGTREEFPECPFDDGDLVTASLVVAYRLPVSERRHSDDDLSQFDAQFELVLYPSGLEVVS